MTDNSNITECGKKVLNLQSSQIADFHRCPRMFYYRYVLWRDRKGGGALLKGSAFHYIAEHYYKDNISLENMYMYILEKYPECEEFIPEALVMFQNYLVKYEDDEYDWFMIDGEPAIELECKIELTDTINYFLKFDGIKERNGKLIAWDYKTSSGYLNDYYFNKYELAYQTFAYSWAARELFPDDMTGFMIDAVSSPKSKNTQFARRFFPLLVMVDEFIAELTRTAEWIQDHIDDEDNFDHNYTSCAMQFGSKCMYSDVCMAPKERRREILMSGLYSDNKPIYDFQEGKGDDRKPIL